MRYLIDGCYGGRNLGDEALLAATLSLLRRADPAAEFRVVSDEPAATEALHGVPAVPHANPFGRTAYGALAKGGVLPALRALAWCDCVVLGGGELFRDDLPLRAVMGAFYRPILGRVLRRRFYAVGVGAQAPTRWAGRRILGRAVRGAHRVLFRDPEGLRLAVELGADPARLSWAPDLVFALGRPVPDGAGSRADGVVRVGVALKAATSHRKSVPRDRAEVGRLVVGALAALGRSCRVRVVPLAFDAPDEPLATALCEQARACGVECELPVPCRLAEARAAVAGLDALVAMPLHASVFGFAAGVPTLGLSYDRKVDKLYHQFDLSEFCLPLERLDGADLRERVTRLMDGAAWHRALLRERADRAGDDVDEAFRRLFGPDRPVPAAAGTGGTGSEAP